MEDKLSKLVDIVEKLLHPLTKEHLSHRVYFVSHECDLTISNKSVTLSYRKWLKGHIEINTSDIDYTLVQYDYRSDFKEVDSIIESIILLYNNELSMISYKDNLLQQKARIEKEINRLNNDN